MPRPKQAGAGTAVAAPRRTCYFRGPMDGAPEAEAPTAGLPPGRAIDRSGGSAPLLRRRKAAPQTGSQRRGIVVTLVMILLLAPLVALSPWVLSGALIVACGIYVAFEFALVKVPLH